MNSHSDIQKRLSAYCGGDVEPAERDRIEAHLSVCPACRADLADIRTTLHVIRTTPQIEPPSWMTSRIMAHLREEQTVKRSWLKRIWFPQHTGFPVRILALLVVCISGFYLSRVVETDLRQTSRQQLQEFPSHTVSAPKKPAGNEKTEQPAAAQPQKAYPSAARQELLPPQTVPQVQSAAPVTPYAPAPPPPKDQLVGKTESMKTAPTAASRIRIQDATGEMKKKSSHSFERGNDTTALEVAGHATGAPAGLALPRMLIRLSANNPVEAPTLIREAVHYFGGTIVDEQRTTNNYLKLSIPADRYRELLERLERLGRITERPAPPPGTGRLDMVIHWN